MVPWVMTAKKEKTPKKKKQHKRNEGEAKGQEGGEMKGEGREQRMEKAEAPEAKPESDKTFLRYYHLYRKGELEADIKQAGGMVLESGYEKDNWWAIASLK